MNLKKCKICGQVVPEGNYCDQCGALLATMTPKETLAEKPVVEPVQQKTEEEKPITGGGSEIANVIRLKQIKGGNVRLILKPDTIIGRKEGPYADDLKDLRFISSKHARVTMDRRRWWIEDLKSTNRTYVNNDELKPGEPHPFGVGDILDLGTMIFEVI